MEERKRTGKEGSREERRGGKRKWEEKGEEGRKESSGNTTRFQRLTHRPAGG